MVIFLFTFLIKPPYHPGSSSMVEWWLTHLNALYESQTAPVQRIDPSLLYWSLLYSALWGLPMKSPIHGWRLFTKRVLDWIIRKPHFVNLPFNAGTLPWLFPAAVLIKKLFYKTGILLGLGLYLSRSDAFFYPSSSLESYGFLFLASPLHLTLWIGISRTTANPYIWLWGPNLSATPTI